MDDIMKQVLDRFKSECIPKIIEIIPDIINEVLPSIIKIIKDKMNESDHHEKEERSVTEEYDLFRQNNHRFFDERLARREEIFYKFTRCNMMLDLYTDCMKEEPLYIPRKFRNDKYHLLSQNELNSLRKSEFQRFKSECEIIRIRRDNFTDAIFLIDKEVLNFIDKSTVTEKCKETLKNRWNTLINEDMSRINEKWTKKIKSTKYAFEKDKEIFKTNQENRILHFDKRKKIINKKSTRKNLSSTSELSFFQNTTTHDVSEINQSNNDPCQSNEEDTNTENINNIDEFILFDSSSSNPASKNLINPAETKGGKILRSSTSRKEN